jgi:hypothetical protein
MQNIINKMITTNKFKIIFIVFILFTGNICGASPQIESVTGVGYDGNNIVINGSGFGYKENAEPLISSFDSDTIENNWDEPDNFPSGDWERTSGDAFLSSAQTRSNSVKHNYSLSCTMDGWDNGYDKINYNIQESTRDVYVSWWQYRDMESINFAEGTPNAKFFRLYHGNVTDVPNIVFTLWPTNEYALDGFIMTGDYLGSQDGDLIYHSSECNTESWGGTNLTYGTHICAGGVREWNHFEIFVRWPSTPTGEDGSVLWLVDGETVGRVENARMDDGMHTPGSGGIVLIGNVTGAMDPISEKYISDVYIDKTVAHVYLSESATSTWPDMETKVHTENQVASEWSNNSISITFNQGSFNSGDQVYLYVIDENGNVNQNGYPITIGQSSTTIRADVDNNSTINTTDAMLTLRNSLGLNMSSTNWFFSATTGDVNCDNVSNSTDAMLILRHSLGLDMSGTGWCE